MGNVGSVALPVTLCGMYAWRINQPCIRQGRAAIQLKSLKMETSNELLKFTEFKAQIHTSLSETLNSNGFVFSKSRFSFKRKLNNNVIEVAFDFLNNAPQFYEYNFCVIVWVKKIQDITKDFLNTHQLTNLLNGLV